MTSSPSHDVLDFEQLLEPCSEKLYRLAYRRTSQVAGPVRETLGGEDPLSAGDVS